MYDKELESLRNAKSDLERTWLITRFFLDTLAPELADAVLRAAVPHWFNPPILAAILDTTEDAARAIIDQMLSFPFVEPFGSLGLTIHDATRSAVLAHLAEAAPEHLRTTAERALTYFASFDDPQYTVERLYHFVCLHPKDGLEKFRRQEKDFRDQSNFSAANNLLRNIEELVELKIVTDKTISTEVDRQHYLIASKRLEVAQKANMSEEVQEHLGEAAKTFGFEFDAIRNERQPDIDKASQSFERDFLLKKLKEAEAIGDSLKQSMWLGEIGTTYWESENYQEALDYINRALETIEIYDKALTYRGQTHRRMGNYEFALLDFDRAIELNGKNEWAIAQRGEVYRMMKNYESALTDFNRAIELNGKNEWAIAGRGETYRQMENYELALADFNRAIKLNEKYAWATTLRGLTYRLLKNYKSALMDFNRTIELDNKDAWTFAQRGLTYRLLKNYKSALMDFNRAIELDDKYAWVFAQRGETHRLMKNYKNALIDFTRSNELDEKFAWPLGVRGQTYRQMKNYENALVYLNRAIELDDKDAWAFAQRGVAYRLLKNYKSALMDFNRAIELNEKSAWIVSERSKTYWSMKKYVSATADFFLSEKLFFIEAYDYYKGLLIRLLRSLADLSQRLKLLLNRILMLFNRYGK